MQLLTHPRETGAYVRSLNKELSAHKVAGTLAG